MMRIPHANDANIDLDHSWHSHAIRIFASHSLRGFTLLELILTVGIAAIVLAAIAPAATHILVTNQLQEEFAEVMQTLRAAQGEAAAQRDGVPHGVSFAIDPNGPDAYTLYTGASYAARDQSRDRVIAVHPSVALTISASFPDTDVVFALGTGQPDSIGAVTLQHTVTGQRIVALNRYGAVTEVRATSADITGTQDATIDQGAPLVNDGSGATLRVYPRNIGLNRRSILAFDLSGIPPGARIDRADLTLKETATFGQTRTIALHRVTRSWTESQVTWPVASTGTNWTTGGGDYDATPTDTKAIAWTGMLKTDTWDVRADVQRFVDGTAVNSGWVLKDRTEDTSEAFWYFSSREGATPPQLSVAFSF